MKQDEIFPGAIVLARESGYKKRSRHEVIEVFSTSVKLKIKGKDNSFFFASLAHVKPAKITRNALVELGFNWDASICQGRNKICNQYKYAIDDEREARVTLKKDCDLWGSNVIFWRGCYRGVQKVSYIHEVQRTINQQK